MSAHTLPWQMNVDRPMAFLGNAFMFRRPVNWPDNPCELCEEGSIDDLLHLMEYGPVYGHSVTQLQTEAYAPWQALEMKSDEYAGRKRSKPEKKHRDWFAETAPSMKSEEEQKALWESGTRVKTPPRPTTLRPPVYLKHVERIQITCGGCKFEGTSSLTYGDHAIVCPSCGLVALLPVAV